MKSVSYSHLAGDDCGEWECYFVFPCPHPHPPQPSSITWGAVPAYGADVLWHSPGARTLVVDVPQALQARRRLDVLWAANTVHRIHLRTTGRQNREQRQESWSWGGHNWASAFWQIGGGSRGEVRVKCRAVSWHSPTLLPLFSHFAVHFHSYFLSPRPHALLWKCLMTGLSFSVKWSHAQWVGGAEASVWGFSYRFFNVCWRVRGVTCAEGAVLRQEQQRALMCGVFQYLRVLTFWTLLWRHWDTVCFTSLDVNFHQHLKRWLHM